VFYVLMPAMIGLDYPDHWKWEDFVPSRLASLMTSFDAPWWVAGGRVLDLWMGRQTRAHQDVDVVILRHDQKQLHQAFDGWELYYATPDHRLLPYRSECWLETSMDCSAYTDKVREDFDRLADLPESSGWDHNAHYHPFLLKHLPPRLDEALEVGCGTGAFARVLAERCGRVVAIDLSPAWSRWRERARGGIRTSSTSSPTPLLESSHRSALSYFSLEPHNQYSGGSRASWRHKVVRRVSQREMKVVHTIPYLKLHLYQD
jgi:hypothetical protein